MRQTVPTIAAAAISKLLETLPGLGLDSQAVCAAARFDASVVRDSQARVPLVELYALWEETLARLGRPDAALVVAARFTPGDYGLLGFVCMTCATLGEALHHTSRYLLLWASEPRLRIGERGLAEVVYRRRLPDRPGLRLATEAALAEILNGARILAQQPALAPAEVWFEHPAPASVAAHEAFFKAPVRFGQRTTAMRFTAEQLRTPLPVADPQLSTFLKGLADQALARADPAGTFIEQVRTQLAESLPKGMPELGKVARGMAMSERTLRRRLEEEKTSFRELRDQTRSMLAEQYLRDDNIALSEVAFLLGFSEPSAFHRAFRRWFGKTPVEFRRRPSARPGPDARAGPRVVH